MGTGVPEGGSRRRARASSLAFTIDELAARADMTVRNVRAHQSRGLLPPPTLVGRVGHYGEEHLDRLLLIRALQKDGFNLVAIVSLLAAGPRDAERVRRLRPTDLQAMDIGPLAELSDEGREALQRYSEDLGALVDVGILRRLPDGTYAASSSALLAAARRLRAVGVTYDDMAGVLHGLAEAARGGATQSAEAVAALCGSQRRKQVTEASASFIAEAFHAVYAHCLDRSVNGSGGRRGR